MRPDRVVVGECRGGEALDMLQAMNTGHDGSLTTGHANSPEEMMQRLQVMVMEAGEDMPASAIRQQIASAVDVVVQIARQRDRSRKITHISEVVGYDFDREQIIIEDIFRLTNNEEGNQSSCLQVTCRPSSNNYWTMAALRSRSYLHGANTWTHFHFHSCERLSYWRQAIGWLIVSAALCLLNEERIATTFEAVYEENASPAFLAQLRYLGPLVALILITWVTGKIIFALMAAVVIYVAPKIIIERIVKGRREKLEQQASDVMLALSSSLKSGLTVEQAVDDIASNMSAPASRRSLV